MLKRLAAGLLAVLLLAVASNQCITRGYIYAEEGVLWSWSGSAPSWSGSLQGATYSDFTTYVANNDSCGGSSTELITYGVATTCGVLASLQQFNAVTGGTNFDVLQLSVSAPITLSLAATCSVGQTETIKLYNALNEGGTLVATATVDVSTPSDTSGITTGSTGNYSAILAGDCGVPSTKTVQYYGS